MKYTKSTALCTCAAIFSITLHAMQEPKSNQDERLENMIIAREKQAHINEEALRMNTSSDSEGNVPRQLSEVAPHAYIYKAIENGANVDIIDKHGTPLSHISAAYDPAILPLLLESGANPNMRNEENNETPLHKTVQTQDINASLALVRYGANPNIRNQDGQTPFTLSVQTPQLFWLFLYEGGNIADLSPQDIDSIRNKTILTNQMGSELRFYETEILSHLKDKSYLTPDDAHHLIPESQYQTTEGAVFLQDGTKPYYFSVRPKPLMRRACACLALEHGWWDTADTILNNYVHKQDYRLLSDYTNYLYRRYTQYLPRPDYVSRLREYRDDLEKKYDNKELDATKTIAEQ